MAAAVGHPVYVITEPECRDPARTVQCIGLGCFLQHKNGPSVLWVVSTAALCVREGEADGNFSPSTVHPSII
ncbi:hypothetical protein M407DRAFT_242408 [Tulasnella calospora MUT 4182]|uniref:Uncharacterized protein n=1 Tax=Tulasnella calospora MUT 4182 TaxID=1051891 RepID=A0A0C3QF14_9AGAM|nr:hypothetical protein M407DRAFT_242408 [Tulasnella calospora MUT 4182]